MSDRFFVVEVGPNQWSVAKEWDGTFPKREEAEAVCRVRNGEATEADLLFEQAWPKEALGVEPDLDDHWGEGYGDPENDPYAMANEAAQRDWDAEVDAAIYKDGPEYDLPAWRG